MRYIFTCALASSLLVGGFVFAATTESSSIDVPSSAAASESVELSLSELSPRGEDGGYAMPASGCSIVHRECIGGYVQTDCGRGCGGGTQYSCPGGYGERYVNSCTITAEIEARVNDGGGWSSYSGSNRTIDEGDDVQVQWEANGQNQNGYGGTWNLSQLNCTGTNFNASGDWRESNINVNAPAAGENKVYRITCDYYNLSDSDELRVDAETPPPPPVCNDGTDNDGDGLTDFPNDPGCSDENDNDEFNPPPAEPPPTVTLNANPTTVDYGDATTLDWTSTNAVSCQAGDAWSGNKPVNGSGSSGAINSSQSTVTFRLTCLNSDGVSAFAEANVNVNQPPAPSVSIDADPTTVQYGNTTTLDWNSSNAVSCQASGEWSGNKPVDGTQTSQPIMTSQNSVNFGITCLNSVGASDSDDVDVSVIQPGNEPPTDPNPACTPPQNLEIDESIIRRGDSVTLTWSVGTASTCTLTGPGIGASGEDRTGCDAEVIVDDVQNSGTYELRCGGTLMPDPQPVRVLPTVQET